MSKTDANPFSGLKLSEQFGSPAPGPDQQLFTTPAPPPTSPQGHIVTPRPSTATGTTPKDDAEPLEKGARVVGKEGNREIGKEASLEGKRGVPHLFDLNDQPYRKDSFLFTSEEFEKFDDVKLDLRRSHDIKATKNDLARCAMGYLIEDYERRGPDSELVKRLQRRRPR